MLRDKRESLPGTRVNIPQESVEEEIHGMVGCNSHLFLQFEKYGWIIWEGLELHTNFANEPLDSKRSETNFLVYSKFYIEV